MIYTIRIEDQTGAFIERDYNISEDEDSADIGAKIISMLSAIEESKKPANF